MAGTCGLRGGRGRGRSRGGSEAAPGPVSEGSVPMAVSRSLLVVATASARALRAVRAVSPDVVTPRAGGKQVGRHPASHSRPDQVGPGESSGHRSSRRDAEGGGTTDAGASGGESVLPGGRRGHEADMGTRIGVRDGEAGPSDGRKGRVAGCGEQGRIDRHRHRRPIAGVEGKRGDATARRAVAGEGGERRTRDRRPRVRTAIPRGWIPGGGSGVRDGIPTDSLHPPMGHEPIPAARLGPSSAHRGRPGEDRQADEPGDGEPRPPGPEGRRRRRRDVCGVRHRGKTRKRGAKPSPPQGQL